MAASAILARKVRTKRNSGSYSRSSIALKAPKNEHRLKTNNVPEHKAYINIVGVRRGRFFKLSNFPKTLTFTLKLQLVSTEKQTNKKYSFCVPIYFAA